jgi:pimeloyl-ACP methyl ester carboxylesterase
VEQLTVESPDGTRLGCEVVGDGPALLIVHGSVADRTRWAPVRDALAGSFRLFLMDRRGRGLSAAEADGDYGIEREVDDLAAVVGAIGEPVRILGHSYGGTLALEAAARGGVERLLVYEPAFGTDAGPVFPLAALATVDAAVAEGDADAALVAFFTQVLLLDPGVVALMREMPAWRARADSAHTVPREARAANAYRPRDALAGIGAPVRFLLGTETAPPLQRAARAAHAAVPGSDLRELPGHGHAAMDADPALFAAEVVAWMRSPY